MMKFYEIKGLENIKDLSELRDDAIVYPNDNGEIQIVIRLGALEALELKSRMYFENLRHGTNYKLVEVA